MKKKAKKKTYKHAKKKARRLTVDQKIVERRKRMELREERGVAVFERLADLLQEYLDQVFREEQRERRKWSDK